MFRHVVARFLSYPPIARILILATLAVLLIHASVYAFMTDDAFISFRYASNAAHGHGLVYNPGGEHVEGYTNFLWVLLVALANRFGAAPDVTANVLSVAATIGLWFVVVSSLVALARGPWWITFGSALVFGLIRSVAVWSTGGLETRWFEFLVAGAMALVCAAVLSPRAADRVLLLAGWMLGMAELTRPEGLMLGAAILAVALPFSRAAGRTRMWGLWVATFAAVVASHYLFRWCYYHQWFPNTYYAKAAGRWYWHQGIAYLTLCALEYCAYLWLVPIVLGVTHLVRSRQAVVALMLVAVAGAQLAFVASVGGDHFEYRQIDVVFPLAVVLIGVGLGAMARRGAGRFAAAALLGAIALGVVAIPSLSHVGFPHDYRAAFPGSGATPEARTFLRSPRMPVAVRYWLAPYDSLLDRLTARYVGIRQEEHRLFFLQAERQGRALAQLVQAGVLPESTYIALDCVGAAPYLSGLRTLDRLGLTDSTVAHGPIGTSGMMAHDKMASFEYAQQRGVDLWSLHPARLVWDLSDAYPVDELSKDRTFYYAFVPGDQAIVCLLPKGGADATRRFPRCRWITTKFAGGVANYMEHAVARLHARWQASPDDPQLALRLSHWYLLIANAQAAGRVLDDYARRVPSPSDEYWILRSKQARQMRDTTALIQALDQGIRAARAVGDGSIATRLETQRGVLPQR